MALTNSGSQTSDFIGRRQEMAALNAALEDAIAGRGRVVMLAGEPGIGKSRIAQELASRAESLGAQVLWGWCYEHRGAPPYWPWLQGIRYYMEEAEPGRLRQDMGPGAADLAEILPELNLKLDGLERPLALDPEEARFRLFFSITNFLKSVSRIQPLVLVLDDLHWADESSLLLLEFLAREMASSPIMVVGAYRDNEITGSHPLAQTLGILVREPHFQRIQMTGLTRQEVGEFVQSRAGVSVPDTAVDTLHQRTDGNPLFVSEVVGSVGQEEMARDQDWISGIPEAIREAILRRLNRLSEPCRQLLRTASVIGRDFELPLLRALCPEIAEDELMDSLDEALGVRIIESLPSRAGEYRFSHVLIQQAVYEEIPIMRRCYAYLAAGNALENLHRNDLSEHADELAYHFAEAEAVAGTEKLVRYSLVTGERALETFAHEQALVHFGRVLVVKEGQVDDAETATALFGLGRAQGAIQSGLEMGQAQLNLIRAFDYYASAGDTARFVEIAEFQLPQLVVSGQQSGRLVVRALELVPVDSLEAGRLHSLHGHIQGLLDGDYDDARHSLDLALSIAKREGNAALEMRTLRFAAQVELWQHHFEDCLESSLRAIDLAVAGSDLTSEISAWYWASISASSLGDLKGARLQASAILKPAEQLRDRFWLTSAYSTVSRTHIYEGDWQSAREVNQRGLDLMPLGPRILLQQVVIETQSGNLRGAELHLERMEESIVRSGVGPNSANAFLALGLPMAMSIFGAVEMSGFGERSITAVASSPSMSPFFSTFVMVGASLLAVMNDDIEEAGRRYAGLVNSAGVVAAYANVDRILGRLSQTMGKLDLAAAHFEDALAFC